MGCGLVRVCVRKREKKRERWTIRNKEERFLLKLSKCGCGEKMRISKQGEKILSRIEERNLMRMVAKMDTTGLDTSEKGTVY